MKGNLSDDTIISVEGQPVYWPAVAPSAGADVAPNAAEHALGVSAKNKAVTDQLATAKRQEIKANESALGQIEKASAQIPQLEEMSKKAGIEAEKLKPWDADAESKKRQTDPVEVFGSIGSVFGILASAFTHAPMENALNASAAAINAIKAGKEQDYTRAYKAWQDNTKQALDRHKIEHAAFEDAVTLMKTDMDLGLAQFKINAMRFGNQKDLIMAENGMIKEIVDYHTAYNKLAKDTAESLLGIELAHGQLGHYWGLIKQFGGQIGGDPTDEPHQKAHSQFRKEQIEEERAKHSMSFGSEWLGERTNELIKQGVTPTEAGKQAQMEQSEARKAGLTGGQQLKEQHVKENVEAVSNQIDYAMGLIDEGKKSGDSVVGVRGAVGRAIEWWRGTESSHDRFISQVKQIQQQVRPLLTGSSRALFNAKDRADMDKIAAGLGYFTSEKQARDVLNDLKKRLNHINLLPAQDGVPVPERYKNEPDGTEFPQKSTGRIWVKKGNMLVPKD